MPAEDNGLTGSVCSMRALGGGDPNSPEQHVSVDIWHAPIARTASHVTRARRVFVSPDVV